MSPSTVTRALTAPDVVQPETRARVQQAAAALGYQPNRAARGLITGRTGNLGLIVPDLTNPFFPGVVKGVQARAREADYSVFLADTDEDATAEAELVRALTKQVDGIVLCSPRTTEEELRTLAGETPMVLINRRVGRLPSVTIDNTDAIRQAVGPPAGARPPPGRASWPGRAPRGPTASARGCCARRPPRPASSWSSSATSRPSSTAAWRPPTWCSRPASRP